MSHQSVTPEFPTGEPPETGSAVEAGEAFSGARISERMAADRRGHMRWWKDHDGTLRPGKSGVNLVTSRYLRPLAKALADALAKAEELGLIKSTDVDSPRELAGAE